ncbi:solute carrier family 35 member F6-like [Tubulanus polymorphus]|uniref:solute carrier family 35 member F6-like n=1 Tax=Tubulanus polymorphus TaxID=672921 RepID=UPI003DA604CC
MALSCYQVLLAVGMLVTGSINTISKKAQNDVNVAGYYNASANNTATPHDFHHPWFQTIIMFMGEFLCLIGFAYHRKKQRDEWQKELQERFENGEDIPDPPDQGRVCQLILAIPTICDLIGTSVAGIGLIYVNGSVWQMLRGSMIVFAGIFSRIFLKRKLKFIHWSGIFIVCCGLVLVGISSVLEEKISDDAKNAIIGIVLIVCSQIVSAGQMIIEEMFLKKKNFHPLQVVGMEGTYGFLIMAFAVLPAMYFIPGSQLNNCYENSIDALYQIKNSPSLLIFCILYLLSIAFYNYFGLAVTKSLTAVHRTLIDACRTILVWIVDLVIYYAFDKNFGEEFNITYGLLQIDGFFFLMIGTALYNELIDLSWLPCFRQSGQQMDTVHTDRQNIQDNDIDDNDDIDERTKLLRDTDSAVNS